MKAKLKTNVIGIASGFNLLEHLGEYDATSCVHDFSVKQCGEK